MGKDKKRIYKTVTWRTISTIVTFFIVFALTGKFMLAANIALINIVVKSIMYYYHEKYWDENHDDIG